VTKPACRGARGNDQFVVSDTPDAAHRHSSCGQIDTVNLAQQHFDIALVNKQCADRRGNVGRRQSARRNLVQQGLEQMMIVTVDQHHIHRRLRQAADSIEPAKTGADHHHLRTQTFQRPVHRRPIAPTANRLLR
jgi:hypothetical protein